MRRLAMIIGCTALGAGLAGCGGSDSGQSTGVTPTTITTTPESEVVRPPKPDFVVLVAGKTISGGGRKTVKLGSTVRLQVVADATDEVHLHGYDKKVDVVEGKPANLTFKADVPGIFEIELEKRGLKLIDLVVK
jgi:hypothetical protein